MTSDDDTVTVAHEARLLAKAVLALGALALAVGLMYVLGGSELRDVMRGYAMLGAGGIAAVCAIGLLLGRTWARLPLLMLTYVSAGVLTIMAIWMGVGLLFTPPAWLILFERMLFVLFLVLVYCTYMRAILWAVALLRSDCLRTFLRAAVIPARPHVKQNLHGTELKSDEGRGRNGHVGGVGQAILRATVVSWILVGIAGLAVRVLVRYGEVPPSWRWVTRLTVMWILATSALAWLYCLHRVGKGSAKSSRRGLQWLLLAAGPLAVIHLAFRGFGTDGDS